MKNHARLRASSLLAIAFVEALARVAAADPSAATQSAGNARFAAGKKLADAHRCREAVVELQASLDAIPSPNTRLILGRCYLQLGQVATAHLALSKAATDARELAGRGDARYNPTAETASTEAAAIDARVPRITLIIPTDAPDGLTLVLDGAPLAKSAAGTPLELDPGAHTVEVGGAGVAPRKQSFEAREAQNDTVAIVVEHGGGAGSAGGGNDDVWAVARKRANLTEGTGKSYEDAEADRRATGNIVASHSGLHVGFAPEIDFAVTPVNTTMPRSGNTRPVYAQIGGGGSFVVQYGISRFVDARGTAFVDVSGPNFAFIGVGASAAVHFNIGSSYTMAIGVRGGADILAGSNGTTAGPFIGPEVSVVGFRFGALREYELAVSTRVPVFFYTDDSYPFPSHDSLAWVENAVSLTYLFVSRPPTSSSPVAGSTP